ncbi:MAG: alanine/ornithine racemase family PLP-dependent enzyme [Candidatus Thermoplasmatota archaeon]|nr:alanine/ornithine racemase family PLP-dependent enzyme [Candidatus Thermoplasmatota archaeon]
MSLFPKVHIDLDKIQRNAKTIVDIAERSGIKVFGVTKATTGDPKVGKAMIDGGVTGLADSRISNIKRLKSHLPAVSCMLLRTPMFSEIAEVIRFADCSINTELAILKALASEATKQCKTHEIILMAELGERREGILNEEFQDIISCVQKEKSLQLRGIAMNLTCFSGVIPTEQKLNDFLKLVDQLESNFDVKFEIISGGNTANIPRLIYHPHTSKINQLRVGEGILLGRETIQRTAIEHTFQDAFILEAELIEVKKKPSVPDGIITENAFGEKKLFEDKGLMIRGIAAIGMQDVIIDDLSPCDSTVSIIGGSSDHLILELPNETYTVGDTVRFIPKYGALVHLFTSPYVMKTYEHSRVLS